MAERIVDTFDLKGPLVRVDVPDDDLAWAFRKFLEGMETGGREPPAYHIEVDYCDAIEQPQGPADWSGPIIYEEPASFWQEPDAVTIVMPETAVMRLEKDRALVRVLRDRSRRFAFVGAPILLEAAVAACGGYLVHAACLEIPGRGECVLIFGASGRGKSTTTMALAGNGFVMQGDDCSVIFERDGRFHAWGLPRAPKIHRNSAEMLGWSARMPDEWNKDGEQMVERSLIVDLIAMARPSPLPVGAVVTMGPRRGNDAHEVAPAPAINALVVMAEDNVANEQGGKLPWNRPLLDRLMRLARDCPVFELRAGRELSTIARTMLSAFDTVRERESAAT
ncbi:MAG: hypothetical protein AB7L41_00840 [Flavobacteriaceae bacterium]